MKKTIPEFTKISTTTYTTLANAQSYCSPDFVMNEWHALWLAKNGNPGLTINRSYHTSTSLMALLFYNYGSSNVLTNSPVYSRYVACVTTSSYNNTYEIATTTIFFNWQDQVITPSSSNLNSTMDENTKYIVVLLIISVLIGLVGLVRKMMAR